VRFPQKVLLLERVEAVRQSIRLHAQGDARIANSRRVRIAIGCCRSASPSLLASARCGPRMELCEHRVLTTPQFYELSPSTVGYCGTASIEAAASRLVTTAGSITSKLGAATPARASLCSLLDSTYGS